MKWASINHIKLFDYNSCVRFVFEPKYIYCSFRKSVHFIVVLIFSLLATVQQTNGQIQVKKELLENSWKSSWITHPDITGEEYGVYLFQKAFNLKSVQGKFIIHISADNRYKLYVNGHYICNGPARGDLQKWRFETVDISQHLTDGKNLIGVTVWNFAEFRPIAQISKYTGLIIQGDSDDEKEIITNASWKVFKLDSYKPNPFKTKYYYAVGASEKFDARLFPWNWQTSEMTGEGWKFAKELASGTPVNGAKVYGAVPNYLLLPREIPLLEESKQFFAKVRRTTVNSVDDEFISGEKKLVIPPDTRIKFLLDQSQLTTAYPVLEVSKGKNAEIKLIYAESLINQDGSKGNRNEIEGKIVVGNQDVFIADGGSNRLFQPLWWRTFRYVEVEVTTGKEELEINKLYSIFTSYPFKEKASFVCDDSLLSDIWRVGWHTQRLCSGETYFDCPYYEQLQYTGDTRIQCLISYYVSGDDRLMRKAISDYRDSQMPFKLTQSRYPCYQPQIIAPFSLYWVAMVYDYWMLQKDDYFVRSMIPTMLDVLQWYEARVDTSNNLLGHMEWWNFSDWVDGTWKSGEAPGLSGANSSVLNLQYMYTIQLASKVFDEYKMNGISEHYLNISKKIGQAVLKNSWDSNKKLIADTPEKKSFSQHANIMGILSGIFPGSEKKIMQQILNDSTLAQCSYYYQFYLTQALSKAGMAQNYPDMLTPWKEMLDRGLTTFPEKADPTRSDCHAWSASPLYFYLSLICGIQPAEPGFNKVLIEPHLGRLKKIEAHFPHRNGDIYVRLNRKENSEISGEIILPEKLTGVFVWNGKQIKLNSGLNKI